MHRWKVMKWMEIRKVSEMLPHDIAGRIHKSDCTKIIEHSVSGYDYHFDPFPSLEINLHHRGWALQSFGCTSSELAAGAGSHANSAEVTSSLCSLALCCRPAKAKSEFKYQIYKTQATVIWEDRCIIMTVAQISCKTWEAPEVSGCMRIWEM